MGKLVDAVRGMTWVRLECAFPRHPKVLALVEDRAFRAVTVYVSSLAYSGEHGLDGFIPRFALPMLHGTQREADQLVSVGLWDVDDSGGWLVHDWHDYQPSEAQQQERREKARKAARKRWDTRHQNGHHS